ncbi:MAG: class I SAM-dependent methyltransferase [Nitrospiraceae bacterium]
MTAVTDLIGCVCGLTQHTPRVWNGSGHNLWCDGCGLFVRRALPCDDDIEARYRRDYWVEFSREQASTARDNIYRHTMARIHSRRGAPGTLVDVGCGAGRLLMYAQVRGWRAEGFELCEQAAEHGRARGAAIRLQSWLPCPLDSESVDAVTFINVLDHLPRPFDALTEAWRVLRPGGVLYVRVPNGPLHAQLSRLASMARIPDFAILHLYGFGKQAFQCHLPRLGFTDVDVRTSPPTQSDAYEYPGLTGSLRRALKRMDYLGYTFSRFLGFDRLAWGLSVEVMAVKASCS